MDAQPAGRWKTWCQETTCHLSEGTGCYLASWSWLCSAVLRPWRRGHNVSWHQVFCNWECSRRVLGFTMGSWIHDGFLHSRCVPGFTMGSWIHHWTQQVRCVKGPKWGREQKVLAQLYYFTLRLYFTCFLCAFSVCMVLRSMFCLEFVWTRLSARWTCFNMYVHDVNAFTCWNPDYLGMPKAYQ